ncbi:MAG: hypothetical protein Q4P72_06435 [Eubacteriales bacterium]|nr:hypothetical protein [Eubacteriales bacterium]
MTITKYAFSEDHIWRWSDCSFVSEDLGESDCLELGSDSFVLNPSDPGLYDGLDVRWTLHQMQVSSSRIASQFVLDDENSFLIALEIHSDDIEAYRLYYPNNLDLRVIRHSHSEPIHIPPQWVIGKSSSGSLFLCSRTLFPDIDNLFLGLEGDKQYVDKIFNISIATLLDIESGGISACYRPEVKKGLSQFESIQDSKVYGVIFRQVGVDIAIGTREFPTESIDVNPCCFPVGGNWFVSLRKFISIDFPSHEPRKEAQCILGVELMAALGWDFYALWDTSSYIRQYCTAIDDKRFDFSGSRNSSAVQRHPDEIIVSCLINNSAPCNVVEASLIGVLFKKDNSFIIVRYHDEIKAVPLSNSNEFFAPLPTSWVVVNLVKSDDEHKFLFVGELFLLKNIELYLTECDVA